MKAPRAIGVLFLLFCELAPGWRGSDTQALTSTNTVPELSAHLRSSESSGGNGPVGEGFSSAVQTFSVEAGVAPGVTIFGSREAHDLALLSLSYGHKLGVLVGDGRWYRGNFEVRGELFGGGQYSPSSDWVIGLTPHLRYDFDTRSRWIPFLDIGAGVTATGIGAPDLSGTFEFNLQAGTGVHWFFRDNMAVTSEVRYLHMSCAGIHQPNLGANNVAFMIGLSWFFGK
jgi:hypothetical protein